MKIARTLILIFAVIACGSAIQGAVAGKVFAGDVLTGTCWEDDGSELCFKDGGRVAYEDMLERKLSGTYSLNGNSVSVSFGSWPRASATINGNKMSGTWQDAPDKEPFTFTLTRSK